MHPDFGLLQIQRLIIHEIPLRSSDQSIALRVTDIEGVLTQTDKNFFSERIKKSLTKARYNVLFDPEVLDSTRINEDYSPVPSLIHKIFIESNENPSFVTASQAIATHLYGCQNATNPPGVLAIAKSMLGEHQALVILKLKKEDGVQYEARQDEDGLVRCSVNQLSNLMMTGGEVFKVGLFVYEGDDISSIRGYISDKQQNARSPKEVADFFLKKFLGCILLDSPDILTKRLFNTSQKFFNEEIKDPSLKIQYGIALLSEIQNNKDSINPADFARDNLKKDDQGKFLNYLGKECVPIYDFPKKTNLIKNLIKRMQLSFHDLNLTLLGDPDSIRNVEIENTKDNKVKVTFEAELEKLGK